MKSSPMDNKEPSNGKCALCGGIYSKRVMKKHLDSCRTKKSLIKENIVGKDVFLILVEGKYYPQYWMFLEVDADATLYELDKFLRKIWLECCGHLSAFTIGTKRYISYIDESDDFWAHFWGREPDKDMDIELNKVLALKMKFYYVYDFGSSTELVLKVAGKYQSEFQDESVRLLARNEPPKIICGICGKKIATQVCPICIDSPEGWFCDDCSRKHKCDECDEEMFLPVVNSPRVGTCGYTGE